MRLLEDQPRDLVGMPDGEAHCDAGSRARHPEQIKVLYCRRSNHSPKVGDVMLEPKRDVITIRKSFEMANAGLSI